MGAPDLLQHLRDAGFTVAPADGGGIRVAPAGALTNTDRQSIRGHRDELLSLLTAAPQPDADPDRWCWPHSDAMNGAELAAFSSRAQMFILRGVDADTADALADRLVIRDRHGDDRRMCMECNAYRPTRCGNHRRAGLPVPGISRDLAVTLQRCDGFAVNNTEGARHATA